MTNVQLLSENRQEILALAQQYGAKNVRVFGSVARGEDNEQSDIDFLVEMEPTRSLFDLGGFMMALQELLECSVDVVAEDGLKMRIRERVLQEAVAL
jgi:predicted nucleotidyltransferase